MTLLDLRATTARMFIRRLSPQEVSATAHACDGITIKAIAERMNIAPDTVTEYLASARERTGAPNTTALAVIYTISRRGED